MQPAGVKTAGKAKTESGFRSTRQNLVQLICKQIGSS
jgi:hypothetical protein